MPSPNTVMTSMVGPSSPEAVKVYDAKHGTYGCNVCGKTLTATSGVLPGTPSPFALMGNK